MVGSMCWDASKLFDFIKEKATPIATYKDILLYTLLITIIGILIYVTCTSFWDLYSRNIMTESDSNLPSAILMIVGLLLGIVYIVFFAAAHKLNQKVWIIFFSTIIATFVLIKVNIAILNIQIGSLLIIGIIIVAPFLLRSGWKKPNWWLIFSIMVFVFFVLAGITIIDAMYGYRPIENVYWNLAGNTSQRYTQNWTNTSMNCTSKSGGKIIGGSEVRCAISPGLRISEGVVKFSYRSGNSSTQKFNASQEFSAPYDITYVYFEVNNTEEGNKSAIISTGFPHQIYQYEDSKKRYNDFLSSLFILITGVLFIIPAMMINIRDLWQGKNESSGVEDMTKYFAYGSNLNQDDLNDWFRKRHPDKSILLNNKNPHVAVLDGYEIVFDYNSSSRKCRVADLKRSDERVWGVLFDMNSEDMKFIEEKEGVRKKIYHEELVEVKVAGQRIKAKTYIVYDKLRKQTSEPPSKQYLEYINKIIDGAERFELPKEWIGKLKKFRTQG